MKVFIWNQDFLTDYWSGYCVIHAECLKDALDIAQKELDRDEFNNLGNEPDIIWIENEPGVVWRGGTG